MCSGSVSAKKAKMTEQQEEITASRDETCAKTSALAGMKMRYD